MDETIRASRRVSAAGVKLDPRRSRWALVAILLLALALRLIIVLSLHNEQYSDSVWYDSAAARLAGTGEYGPHGPSAWFPPGYPFFLAGVYRVFGHAQIAGKIANALLGTLVCLLAYQIGRKVFSESVGLVAAFLMAVWPNTIFHVAILDSETLSMALFALTLWIATWKPSNRAETAARIIALGVALGWGMLTRPVAITLVAVVGLWWFRSQGLRRTTRDLGLAGVLAASFVLAWSERNYHVFGQRILLATNGGYNFWQSNHRLADGTDSYWNRAPMNDPEFRTMRFGDEFTRNREGYRYGWAYLRAHPFHLIALAPAKLVLLYGTDTSGLYEAVLYAPESGPSTLAAWFRAHAHLAESATYRFYFLLMIPVLFAIFVARREWRPSVATLLLLPILLFCFHLFFQAKDRFHVPLSPILALLAASAVAEMARRLRHRGG